MQWARKQTGFTIVELLIVVVVIAILAAITIVAYNGIQNRAKDSSLQSEVASLARKVEALKAQSTTERYPSDLSDAGVSLTDVTYTYSDADNSFCVSKVNGDRIFSASSAQSAPQAGVCGTNGLVAWYPMNGNMNNAVSGGVNATGTDVSTISGQGGVSTTAYSFNGTTSQIYAPTSFGLSGRNLTLATWVHPSNVTGNKGLFMKVGNVSGATASTGGIAIGMGASSGFGTAGRQLGALYENVRWIMSPVQLSVTTWQHVALSITSDGIPTLYLNGEIVGTYPGLTGNISTNGTVLGGYSSDRYFNGRMDDARIFNRGLTGAEIKALYLAGAQ